MKKGTPHFLYTNKDSPDYVAPFAPFYSDRQKAILSGELSVEEVELRELGRLRNKARNMGDEENLEIANILYEEKSNPSAGLYKHYTAEEAAEILRKLTRRGLSRRRQRATPMDTSHRNNVPPCEDDDDIWYWGYSIFVPHIPDTRAYLNTSLSDLALLYQPMPIMAKPTIITTVLIVDADERKQEATSPVPAPVKKSTSDFSCFIFPNTRSLSIASTILESPFSNVSSDTSN